MYLSGGGGALSGERWRVESVISISPGKDGADTARNIVSRAEVLQIRDDGSWLLQVAGRASWEDERGLATPDFQLRPYSRLSLPLIISSSGPEDAHFTGGMTLNFNVPCLLSRHCS
jgi:hypothetical protein